MNEAALNGWICHFVFFSFGSMWCVFVYFYIYLLSICRWHFVLFVHILCNRWCCTDLQAESTFTAYKWKIRARKKHFRLLSSSSSLFNWWFTSHIAFFSISITTTTTKHALLLDNNKYLSYNLDFQYDCQNVVKVYITYKYIEKLTEMKTSKSKRDRSVEIE